MLHIQNQCGGHAGGRGSYAVCLPCVFTSIYLLLESSSGLYTMTYFKKSANKNTVKQLHF